MSPLQIPLNADGSVTDIPISNISVLDARFDTGMVGLFRSKYIIFGRKTNDEISQYLHSSFRFEDANKNSNSIFVYIKKLWFSNELMPLSIEGIKKDKDISNWKSGLVFKVECLYKQQEVYYPLFCFDTIITTQKNLLENIPGLLTACLERLKEKIKIACVSFNSNGTKVNGTQVSTYYSNRFNIPILSDTIYRKGLYETFAEFQNNQPFCTDFSITIEQLSDEVYIKDTMGRGNTC